MTNETLRIGIIGAGANTRRHHIPGFQTIPGVEVVAVANRTVESAKKAAEPFGITGVVPHWRDIIKDESIDAVCIGTWPNMHAEVTCSALEAGKHVLTEARMARNLDEAKAMYEAAKAHPSLVTQIVPAPMSLNLDSTIQRLIKEGRLGNVREVSVTVTNASNANGESPMSWRQNRELSGNNIMMLGIYHEMVMRWMDEADPVRISADGAIYTPQRKDESGQMAAVEIPESIDVIARWSNGVRSSYHMSGVEAVQPRNALYLNGDKACLYVDLEQDRLMLGDIKSGETTEIEVPDSEKRGWRVEDDFIESIREGKPVALTSFADGLRYMRFIEAVWTSIQQDGTSQSLPAI